MRVICPTRQARDAETRTRRTAMAAHRIQAKSPPQLGASPTLSAPFADNLAESPLTRHAHFSGSRRLKFYFKGCDRR
jgi:hypothetical protein